MATEKKLGLNRTGIDVSPILSKEMVQGNEKLIQLAKAQTSGMKNIDIAENRIRFFKESNPVGSVPLPGTVKGAVQTGLQVIQGHDPTTLIDKLGERLAFERAGVRLYDALLSKYSASDDEPKTVELSTLQEFRNEEYEHFQLVEKTMRSLGADPTAQTPSADIVGVASMGVQNVVVDARISFQSTLEAILIAELADNDGWNLLIQLAENAGLKTVADDFKVALKEEENHLSVIREAIAASTLNRKVLQRKSA